jgi:hypothetical protein
MTLPARSNFSLLHRLVFLCVVASIVALASSLRAATLSLYVGKICKINVGKMCIYTLSVAFSLFFRFVREFLACRACLFVMYIFILGWIFFQKVFLSTVTVTPCDRYTDPAVCDRYTDPAVCDRYTDPAVYGRYGRCRVTVIFFCDFCVILPSRARRRHGGPTSATRCHPPTKVCTFTAKTVSLPLA